MNLSEKKLAKTLKPHLKMLLPPSEDCHDDVPLKAFINSFPLGILFIDLKNRIILRNGHAASILGISKTMYDIEDVIQCFPPELGIKDHCMECLKQNKLIELKDVRLGQKFARVFLSPVMDGKPEKMIGHVLIIEDITEQKIIEKSRDEFFSIASHELRTPLTAIRWNASMLEDLCKSKVDDPDIKEMASDILLSSERLIRIVNDFLDASRLEQGRMTFKKGPLNVSALIETTLAELKNMAAQKSIDLVFMSSPIPPPLISSDKDRVKQVIINLIGNSLKFTDKGSITVSIQLLPGFLKVIFKDTGIGISKENQALLFRKFQQVGKERLDRDISQGTGLGLYISKLIVESLGGKIALEQSDVGKGSVFSFTLPVNT